MTRRPGDGLRFLLMSGAGTGLAPVASGTFGTLPGIALAVLAQLCCSGTTLAIVLVALTSGLLAVGCSFSAFVGRALPGREDPGIFVLDEIVGYLAAITIYVLACGEPTVLVHVIAFFVFRFFDVAKVFPANRLEHLPGAPGIMLDDVAAGLYTGGVLVALQMLQVMA